MSRIRLLDDQLINRIAAGEVAERPASVVKELLENSLDAGARSITIHLAGGGKQSIRVADDGCGMARDDALLAVERHATSKLSHARDLDAIATLGFRGEALPSIAAVSRFLLRTSTGEGPGTELEIRGGRILSVRETGLPRGTTIEVDRLFFNVPARRKFLRADNTELFHAARLVTRYALAHPGVRFLLDHSGRRVLDAPRSGDGGQRVRQVLGARTAEALVPLRLERHGILVHGWAGRPVDARPRREGQHFFVNGRAVQDRVLAHAVTEAYGNTVPRGHHPEAVVFVEMDCSRLDVNVHPRKTEVRFHRSSQVHDTVRDAVHAALSGANAVPRLQDLRPEAGPPPDRHRAAAAALRHVEARSYGQATPFPPAPREPRAPVYARHEPDTTAPLPPPSEPSQLHETLGESGARALAQFHDSYIVAQDRDGLVVVDQHAAHERVIFERLLARAETHDVEVQRLMFPVTLELAPHEMVVLEREAEELRRLGVLVEPFGGNTVRLDGIPALGEEIDPSALLHELLGEAARVRAAASRSEPLRHRLVTTAACKAAIKINHPLTTEGMQALLDDLYATDNPTTCPHGRPILFRLTLDEIERAFRRK